MCGKIFETNPSDVSYFSRQLQTGSTSSSSSMSGYGNNTTNGLQGAPFSLPWTIVPPVQWSNPPLLSCMAPSNNEASSSGFHGGFPYDSLRQSAVYGRKSGFGLNDHHDSSGMLLSNGPAGLLMDGHCHGLGLPAEMVNVGKMTAQERSDAKALAASKSHSEAERRRRERINTHLATLRTMLPSTTKTDKASLLAEVIEHVKDLKRQTAEIAEGSAVPTETDEVTVDPDPESRTLIKASVCCDDRPDLLSDLIKTLTTLNLRTLKAEITTLGGRVNNTLLLDHNDDNNNNSPSHTCIHDALRAVVERPNSEESPPGNKRQRLNPFNSMHLI
ncbi:hypothetical protein KI387_001125 [Taxus chinensis]|uniref:BHLH domain-containing protein n=1 Tax=Taxus chinensis TaxID=29808 RepID=A0AA38LPS1_TAXCH|nr:hypothetical protein KI387_001125 [Taxus chinensis]